MTKKFKVFIPLTYSDNIFKLRDEMYSLIGNTSSFFWLSEIKRDATTITAQVVIEKFQNVEKDVQKLFDSLSVWPVFED